MRIATDRRDLARQRGFTLPEVLATLGVLGVSLSLAVPGLDSITRSNLRATGINELVATLHQLDTIRGNDPSNARSWR